MNGTDEAPLGLAEVSMLIFALGNTIKQFEDEMERLGEDADDRGNLLNDLTLCDSLLEKLQQMEARRRHLLGGGP